MAETIYDGPPSPGDTERALVEVAAQRDQLDQQVRELLERIENHRLWHVGGGLGAFHAAKRRTDEEQQEADAQQDRNLWAAADKVRKERGE